MEKPKAMDRRTFLRSSARSSIALAGCEGMLNGESEDGKPSPEQKTRLVEEPQLKRNFDKDGRSKRVIFTAHCVLNQNARHVDCADFPAMMKPLLAALQENQIGIIQLPCPELMALGLGRDRDVPPLNTIREALELPAAHARLKPLIEQIVYQIKEYRFQGFEIVGILGKNGSPSCGVETTSVKGGQAPGQGVFVRLLREKLKAEGLDIGIKGVDDHRQEEAVDWMSKRV